MIKADDRQTMIYLDTRPFPALALPSSDLQAPPLRPIVFELCAESLGACLAARSGGAHRIELCAALSEDGLTPSHGLTRQAVLRSGLPVHAMLRPRGGDFVYTDDELAIMRADLVHFRELGVSGVVLGLLHPDGRVDLECTAALVALAAPLEVTFHRAFDQAADLSQALEAAIAAGCHRVLTCGGAPDVEAGADTLRRLLAQAAGRIEIAVGGGLRLHNAAAVAHATGARHFHGSLRRADGTVAAEDIRAMMANLSPANF